MIYSSLIVPVTTTLTLVGDIVLVLFVLGLVLRVPFIISLRRFVGRHATLLSLLVALAALAGSLLYSEVLAFDPCILCWIQRIFIYPQIILAGLALYWKDHGITKYLLGLSVPGALVALYHSWTQFGGFSITPCTAVGGSCAKLYVLEYGYVTIPVMALTTFLYIIVLALCRRYEYRYQ